MSTRIIVSLGTIFWLVIGAAAYSKAWISPALAVPLVIACVAVAAFFARANERAPDPEDTYNLRRNLCVTLMVELQSLDRPLAAARARRAELETTTLKSGLPTNVQERVGDLLGAVQSEITRWETRKVALEAALKTAQSKFADSGDDFVQYIVCLEDFRLAHLQSAVNLA